LSIAEEAVGGGGVIGFSPVTVAGRCGIGCDGGDDGDGDGAIPGSAPNTKNDGDNKTRKKEMTAAAIEVITIPILNSDGNKILLYSIIKLESFFFILLSIIIYHVFES
jgi:hypothetical protein